MCPLQITPEALLGNTLDPEEIAYELNRYPLGGGEAEWERRRADWRSAYMLLGETAATTATAILKLQEGWESEAGKQMVAEFMEFTTWMYRAAKVATAVEKYMLEMVKAHQRARQAVVPWRKVRINRERRNELAQQALLGGGPEVARLDGEYQDMILRSTSALARYGKRTLAAINKLQEEEFEAPPTRSA